MATVKELEERIRELEDALGTRREKNERVSSAGGGVRPDHIAFGSPQHAALLGLVLVEEGEDVADYFTHTSSSSGNTYRLADEYEPVRTFPAMDPEKAAKVILRQKIGELEGGKPPIPADAPELWRPRETP